MYFLIDDHGEFLGKFETREEALAAYESFVEDEPLAEVAVIQTDAQGNRVGEPITSAAAAAYR